ncbi:MAG: hypothetical protein NVSMB57_08460 [Actinomycetota bacterium]
MDLLTPPDELVLIDAFEPPSVETTPASALARIRDDAPAFKEWFRSTGTVTGFAARSLVTLPYPKHFGLWDACSLPIPYVWMTNRMFIVQWRDGAGRVRTLLAEPSDYELGIDTPYIAHAVKRVPGADRTFTRHGTALTHLAALGIEPHQVDYVTFDHLHTQDIRRITGTYDAAPDLGFHDRPVPPMFPNAKLLVQRSELAHVREVHPFQARFHQSETYRDIRVDSIVEIDGDVLVAPGLALLRTPGHTFGNHTIVVNTGEGILTSSENGIAVECYAPHLSRIPGVAKWARTWGFEVIMNFNTPEFASWQYNSMVKEKLIADPIPAHPSLPQVFPSSQLTRHPLAPGIRPIFEHRDVTIGTVTGT